MCGFRPCVAGLGSSFKFILPEQWADPNDKRSGWAAMKLLDNKVMRNAWRMKSMDADVRCDVEQANYRYWTRTLHTTNLVNQWWKLECAIFDLHLWPTWPLSNILPKRFLFAWGSRRLWSQNTSKLSSDFGLTLFKADPASNLNLG